VTHVIEIQLATNEAALPDNEQITLWANTALGNTNIPSELSIRIVDETEGAQLNEKWRNINGPTNVLSFPAQVADEIRPKMLGDIVICAPVVIKEAAEQGKVLDSHWAHMIIHGTLHLLGYDHIEGQQARIMESLEIDILNKLDIDNPYV